MSDTKAWCYNLAQKKWDLWSLPLTTEVNSVFSGKGGEIYISQGTSLNTFANGTSTKDFTWHSKDIIVNKSTQDKKFYSTNKVGTASVTSIRAYEDGNDWIDFTTPYRGRYIKLVVNGNSDGEYIDSLGIVFRSFVKVFEGVSST
jgi:hypothetical protein